MSRLVSITLQDNDDARPIIQAIEKDNPDVTVNYFPGMVKIDAEGRLIVKQETVEEILGIEWDVQELQLVLISIAGNLDEEDDYFELSWNT